MKESAVLIYEFAVAIYKFKNLSSASSKRHTGPIAGQNRSSTGDLSQLTVKIVHDTVDINLFRIFSSFLISAE